MDLKKRIAEIEHDDVQTEEHVLYQLLEIAISMTGRGERSDDYTKSIDFSVGGIEIFADPYYGTISIEDREDLEKEKIQKLIDEVKKRLLLFDEKTKNIKEKISTEIFDVPIKEF